jgi:hypothetical protein
MVTDMGCLMSSVIALKAAWVAGRMLIRVSHEMRAFSSLMAARVSTRKLTAVKN